MPIPYYDDCSGSERRGMLSTNKNIGNLLSDAGISWGWFQGGFTPSSRLRPAGCCNTTTNRIDGTPETAYSAHHNPFQYYAARPIRTTLAPALAQRDWPRRPSESPVRLELVQEGGAGGRSAGSQLPEGQSRAGWAPGELIAARRAGLHREHHQLPADAAPGVDEHGRDHHLGRFRWLVRSSMGPIINPSNSGGCAHRTGTCGNGTNSLAAIQARCGYGPRIPFLVISPYARENFVDSTLTDQSSVVRFIEDNWDLPQIGNGSSTKSRAHSQHVQLQQLRTDKLILDPATGQVVAIKPMNGNGNGGGN